MLFMKMDSGLLIDFQQIKHEKLWNWNNIFRTTDINDLISYSCFGSAYCMYLWNCNKTKE